MDRPFAHDEIDLICLEAVKDTIEATRFMIDEIGDDGVPSEATRRNHSERLTVAIKLIENIMDRRK